MSVNVARADGVTVLTLTADSQSSCPPLCQFLKGLCYSPVWCSVSQHLRGVQRSSQSVLGALHIMVGMLNIGLGSILYVSPGAAWRMVITKFPFWLGSLFILFGVMNILSEKLPSPCLVTINVPLNLAGVAFAITAIVLYCLNLRYIWTGYHGWWWWGESGCDMEGYIFNPRFYTPKPSTPQDDFLKKKCFEGKELTMMLLRSINAVLIVLSVLEVCVTISSAVMGIKALSGDEKRDNKNNNDPECD